MCLFFFNFSFLFFVYRTHFPFFLSFCLPLAVVFRSQFVQVKNAVAKKQLKIRFSFGNLYLPQVSRESKVEGGGVNRRVAGGREVEELLA